MSARSTLGFFAENTLSIRFFRSLGMSIVKRETFRVINEGDVIRYENQ
jgi:hypothetical protein